MTRTPGTALLARPSAARSLVAGALALALALLAVVQVLALRGAPAPPPRRVAAAAPSAPAATHQHHPRTARRPVVLARAVPPARSRPAVRHVRQAVRAPRRSQPVRRVVRPVLDQREADRRGRAALASLSFDPRRTGYTVRFRPATRGPLGLTDPATRTVTLYVRAAERDLVLRASLAHELGHALDFSRYTDARHADWVAARHLDPSRSWAPISCVQDYGYGAGDFAEVFALWLVGPGDFRSTAAPQPSPTQLRDLARQFA